ncbi:hypothetical protein [Neisseria sicca]|nr:hypothetical protein [Neisseria sicca]
MIPRLFLNRTQGRLKKFQTTFSMPLTCSIFSIISPLGSPIFQ